MQSEEQTKAARQFDPIELTKAVGDAVTALELQQGMRPTFMGKEISDASPVVKRLYELVDTHELGPIQSTDNQELIDKLNSSKFVAEQVASLHRVW